jgi:hypothetical protein
MKRVLMAFCLLLGVLMYVGYRRATIQDDLVLPGEDKRMAAERLSHLFESDIREPTAENLSGIWTSGPNLGGFDIQLEQRGEKIEGLGYNWGCMGLDSPFRVRGSYRTGVLSVRFLGRGVDSIRREYSSVAIPGGFTLAGQIGENEHRLFRFQEVERQLRVESSRTLSATNAAIAAKKAKMETTAATPESSPTQ